MGWIVDLVAVVLIIIGAIMGGKKGMVTCLCSFIGTIVSAIIAVTLGLTFSSNIAQLIGVTDYEWIVRIVMIIIIFVLLAVILRFIGKGFTNLIEKSSVLKGFNRFLGVIFGIIAAFATACLVIVLVMVLCIDVVPNESVVEFLNSGFLGNIIYEVGLKPVEDLLI